MQSGDACFQGRKCWNLIITSGLSREINEETEKEKKKSIFATPQADVEQMRAQPHSNVKDSIL